MEEVVVVPIEEQIKKQSDRVCKHLRMLLEMSCPNGGWYEGECHNESAFYAMDAAHTLISFFESFPRKRANLDTPNAHRSRWSACKGRLKRDLGGFIQLHSCLQHMLSIRQLSGKMVMGGDYKGALILDFDADGMIEKKTQFVTDKCIWYDMSESEYIKRHGRPPFIIPALFEGEEVQLELAELPGMDELWSCTHVMPAGPMGVWAVLRKVD